MGGGKIVFTGMCCLDIVTYLPEFPAEDSDLRDVDQLFTLGGNATNSTKVASQLNGHSLLFSAIPDRNPLFESVFERFRLDTSLCVRRAPNEEASGVPMTVVLVNLSNGSRTMFSSLGGKQWPTAEDFVQKFAKIDGFGWFHFEVVDTFGLDQLLKMVKHVHSLRGSAARPLISIELEQNVEIDWLHKFMPLADLVFAAKDFAQHLGWCSMQEVVQKFQHRFGAEHATIVCPWGEKGVAAKSGISARLPRSEGIIELAAHKPSSGVVVDTLAAGDCFIAGTVHFLNEGLALEQALDKATFLAGESVGQRGLAGLKIPEICHAPN